MGKFLLSFFIFLSSIIEKNVNKLPSNGLLPQIELHLISCHYPLINYFATFLEHTNWEIVNLAPTVTNSILD